VRPLAAFAFAGVLAGQQVEFNRDIRPILSDRCFACHGPDAANRKSPLRLDVPSAAGKGSEIYARVTETNIAKRMPPAYAGHAALAKSDIETIKRWIDQGAPWQNHWSLVAPTRPNGGGIDEFVRRRLQRDGLKTSAQAPAHTLLRRVYLDLTGLPPSPELAAKFTIADYERVVDQLLASPEHAERMAQRWLEWARYADTNGYQSDGVRDMWRWRDWVIDAYKTNMPFDKFTIEQIAGDLLPNATLPQKIATGFHRNHRTNAEGGIVEEEFRVEYVADRVETTATVWLGLTLGCARCHDHKYDPLTQKDFYSMFAFYNNVPERGLVYNFGNEEPTIKAPTPEMAAKLAEYDAKLRSAEANWNALSAQSGKERKIWERRIKDRKEYDWRVEKGLIIYDDLESCDTPCTVTEGKRGKAAQFNGAAQVSAGDKANFNYMSPYSFAAWVKPESENGTILSRIEDYWEGEGYGLYVKQGNLHFVATRRYTDISLRLETEEKLAQGKWQHLAFTYDGTRKGAGVRIWIDGRPAKIKITFDELTYPFGPKVPFLIGSGGGMKFTGAIDDVRVFDRALTEEEALSTAVLETIDQIAAIPEKRRTAQQRAKLQLAFLDQGASAPIKDTLAARDAARIERDKYNETLPTVMVMVEGPKRQAYLLKRGAYDARGEAVESATPHALPAMKPEWPRNRLGLAQWLVDRHNPLTARVQMNRMWQMFFGTGLVKTVEDLGSQGEWPSHLALLDYLAVEFMDRGWDLRAMEKLIVMSEAYRQTSAASPEQWQRDPENRLISRGPRVRLPAAFVRDQALAVSGLLVNKTGGPSVKPYQPPGLWQELSGGAYREDKGDGLYRRSLYTYWKRTVAPPMMINFDSPTREGCVVRETRTNTPLQALNLMNDVTFVEAARKFAERMIREGGASVDDRVAYAWRVALARAPSAKEASAARLTYDRFVKKFDADPKAAERSLNAGASERDKSLNITELAAYTMVASLILNLDETVTKE